MKLVKRLAIVALAIAILLVALGVIAFGAIDSLARKGIERGTTHALDVPTTLSRADVGVLAGTFEMGGLKIANPAGFDSPHFMRLDAGDVNVSLATLRQDVVELPELNLTTVDVNLQKADGKANYKVILDNLKRFESGKDKPKPAEPKKDGKKFVIRKVEIRDITAHIDLLPIGGDLTKTDIVIPEIILTNVGSGGDGVSMSEVTDIIIKAIFASLANAGALPAELLAELKDGLANLDSLADAGVTLAAEKAEEIKAAAEAAAGEAVDTAKAEADKLKAEAEKAKQEAEKAVKDAVDKVPEGIRGLIPKKKDG